MVAQRVWAQRAGFVEVRVGSFVRFAGVTRGGLTACAGNLRPLGIGHGEGVRILSPGAPPGEAGVVEETIRTGPPDRRLLGAAAVVGHRDRHQCTGRAWFCRSVVWPGTGLCGRLRDSPRPGSDRFSPDLPPADMLRVGGACTEAAASNACRAVIRDTEETVGGSTDRLSVPFATRVPRAYSDEGPTLPAGRASRRRSRRGDVTTAAIWVGSWLPARMGAAPIPGAHSCDVGRCRGSVSFTTPLRID